MKVPAKFLTPGVALFAAGIAIATIFRTKLPAYLSSLFQKADPTAQSVVMFGVLAALVALAIFAWERQRGLRLTKEVADAAVAEAARMTEQLQAEHERNQKEEARLKDQLSTLAELNDHVWVRDPGRDVPRFVPIDERPNKKLRFISVLNLKGGVGKTTVSAYLGAALAQVLLKGAPHQILLVDLDFQGTLSNAAVDKADLDRERARGVTSARLIEDPLVTAEDLRDLMLPMAGPLKDRVRVIPSRDDLEMANLRAEVRYVIYPDNDVRFRFRRIFHTPEFFALEGGFDYVIFDCPPRLTTVAVSALAASDYVVIPTKPDPASIEAIPRTVGWLERLAGIVQARLAGVVVNEVRMRAGVPLRLHGPHLADLEAMPYRVFNTKVPLMDSPWEADETGSWATSPERLGPFLELARDLKRRMPR